MIGLLLCVYCIIMHLYMWCLRVVPYGLRLCLDSASCVLMYVYCSQFEYTGCDLWVVVLIEEMLLIQTHCMYCCIILTLCLGGEYYHMAWFRALSYDIRLCFG